MYSDSGGDGPVVVLLSHPLPADDRRPARQLHHRSEALTADYVASSAGGSSPGVRSGVAGAQWKYDRSPPTPRRSR